MDVNEGCRIEKDGTTGVFTMSWWGRSGRTYFIQHSDDLVTWTYLPLIESGAAAVTEYGFTSTAARGFFRLRASDAPAGGDPDAADFDGDGLTNVQEVGAAGTHTDPLVADTDGDGLSDGAEAAAGTNPRLKDTDGDGFGDALELQAGTNSLTAASSPLHTGQMMLANLLSLWTAYLPVSQTGSLSQQQAAWDAAVEVQEELAALLALVAAAMPESLLMAPVSQPFEQLPLTMPQSQTPPTGDPGKAWLDTWSHEALIGLGQDSYNTDTTLRFSGPNLENYYSMYVDSWDDGHEEGRPVDPQLKRTNFILAVNQAGTYMDEETAKAGNVLDDYGPSWSRQWGAADFVNPASERMVLEVSQNPLGAWALKWFYRICRLRVERAADHERSFVMLAKRWKPATGWQYEGTVTFRVQPKSLEAGIEISGLPWEWFRDNGDLLEMGTLNPLPPALQSLPPGFVSDREKYQLVLLPVELYSDLNNDGQLTSADASLTGKPYASGASEEEKDKGTEFMFVNDKVSNGSPKWDKEDSDTPGKPSDADDDDAEPIIVGIGALPNQTEVWLEHPASAGLKFYSDKKCTQEIHLSSNQHHIVGGSATWPTDNKVYVRAESVTFSSTTNPQVEGDLKLMIKPSGGAAAGIEAAKMNLTVVEKIGATKYVRAVIDYIKENNATNYFNQPQMAGGKLYHVAVLRSQAGAAGFNARPSMSKGIGNVIGVLQYPAFVMNCSYAYNSGVIPHDSGFYGKHGGELYNGSWDTTCSVLGSVAMPAGGGAGSPAWVASKGAFTAPSIDFGTGDVPAGYTDGTGGLQVWHGGAAGQGSWATISEVVLNDEKLIFGAVSGGPLTDRVAYHDALTKAATTANVLLCDGGASIALAIQKPDGILSVRKEGIRHTAAYLAIFNEALKTYVGFSATPLR